MIKNQLCVCVLDFLTYVFSIANQHVCYAQILNLSLLPHKSYYCIISALLSLLMILFVVFYCPWQIIYIYILFSLSLISFETEYIICPRRSPLNILEWITDSGLCCLNSVDQNRICSALNYSISKRSLPNLTHILCKMREVVKFSSAWQGGSRIARHLNLMLLTHGTSGRLRTNKTSLFPIKVTTISAATLIQRKWDANRSC